MKNNYDYIKEFVYKHKYKTKVSVHAKNKLTDINSIQSVTFDPSDIPSMKKFDINDIIYDIESDLPEDVWYRYLQFLNESKKDVSYVFWMTKMDNKYNPMNIDTSESLRIKNLIYDKLNEIKNKKWF